MPLYDYRCTNGHITEEARPMADRELPGECQCGASTAVLFSPPDPHNFRIPMNFRAIYGAPTWSDFHDRTEKELARDPNVEKFAVMASQPGVGDTISQPGAETKRKVREARGRYPSNSY